MQNHGHLLKRISREPNKIITKDNYAEVILYDKNQKEKCKALIDREDIDRVKDYKWYQGSSGYAQSDNVEGQRVLLHKFLMKSEGFDYIDHVNSDKLDNRKSNLRFVTGSQNNYNREYSSNFENEDIGIYYNKDKNLWKTYIGYKNKRIYLGGFKDKKDAIKARRQAEIEYFGEYHYNYKELKEKGLIE